MRKYNSKNLFGRKWNVIVLLMFELKLRVFKYSKTPKDRK